MKGLRKWFWRKLGIQWEFFSIDAAVENIVLLPFAILMIPLFIWIEIRDRRENRKHKVVKNG